MSLPTRHFKEEPFVNKISVVATFIALVACAGMAFSIAELKKVSGSLRDVEERLAKMENAPAAGGGNGAASSGGGSTAYEVAQEIKQLKAEMATVKSEQETLTAAVKTGGTPKTDGAVASKPPVGDELKSAIETVLAEREAAKDKARKEEEAKRAAEWQARMAQGVVDTLTRELGLTEQQKAQVTEIITAQTTAFREAMTNRKEGENPMEKMTALRTETDTKLKAVLTPEQGTKYDELAKNPMALWGGAMGGMGGGGRRNGRGPGEGN